MILAYIFFVKFKFHFEHPTSYTLIFWTLLIISLLMRFSDAIQSNILHRIHIHRLGILINVPIK